MFLVQMLLPIYDNERRPFPRADYDAIGAELTARFGGVTAYTRAPAEGQWRADDADTSRDEIIVLEVLCEHLDRNWWAAYRRALEATFRQQSIVVRAHAIEVL